MDNLFAMPEKSHCQHERVCNLFKAHPCERPANEHGFCTQHAYAARLLNIAQGYGYPELLPPLNKDRERSGVYIGGGRSGWLAYCERVTPEHAKVIEGRLREQCKAVAS